MPAERKLPDKSTLRHLRMQGWRLSEIADEYGVGTTAVWHALERAGFTESRAMVKEILPWKIEPEHKSTAIMQRFRSILKQRNDAGLGEKEEELLTAWLRDLEESDLVVNYHPEAPPNSASRKGGFYYVPRKPDDKWIIREPVTEVVEV